jgi:hypothetical protein
MEALMKKHWGKCLFAGVSILVVCTMFLALGQTPPKVRVGTFDSRVVALAYYRSALFAPSVQSWNDKMDKAKAEKNEKLIQELEAKAATDHNYGMLQVFSQLSIGDILEKVKDKLPQVAQEAGADMIVSQWEVVQKTPSVEIVDITSPLAKLFNPDEQTLKYIEGMLERKQPPIPLLEALKKAVKEWRKENEVE